MTFGTVPVEDAMGPRLTPFRRIGTALLLVKNIHALLEARRQTHRDLADWVGHHETWLSKILKEDRGIRFEDLDRVAAFFDMTSHQLLSPGLIQETDRRQGERRRERERRSGIERRESNQKQIRQRACAAGK